MNIHSQKFRRHRRFLTVVPLLTLPFLTLIFWALGGGQGTAQGDGQPVRFTGLNMELPGAQFKNHPGFDKFSLYQQARRDSIKRREAQSNDPYFSRATSEKGVPPEKPGNGQAGTDEATPRAPHHSPPTADPVPSLVDPTEEQVQRKLSQLEAAINRRPPEQKFTAAPLKSNDASPVRQLSTDVERLEEMMQLMQGGAEDDPEMRQLEGMLEKILDIQHPQRVRERIRAQSQAHTRQVFPVEATGERTPISLLQPKETGIAQAFDSLLPGDAEGAYALSDQLPNAFYGLDDYPDTESETGNAIQAVIHETQSLVSGATVKLRLLNDIYVHGRLIPKDGLVYGTCAISDERLTITIASIRHGHSLFPVSLSVYDLDGMAGIYIPGAITREAAKGASQGLIQGMDIYSPDPSLGAQAATAGINAAKGLLSRKARQIRVTVKAGYRVLLRDTNAPE
jgi:conjugative transposon TraM protein